MNDQPLFFKNQPLFKKKRLNVKIPSYKAVTTLYVWDSTFIICAVSETNLITLSRHRNASSTIVNSMKRTYDRLSARDSHTTAETSVSLNLLNNGSMSLPTKMKGESAKSAKSSIIIRNFPMKRKNCLIIRKILIKR